MTMICDNCGRFGIRWMGRFSSGLTHTECPHCGGINCQRAEQELDNGMADDFNAVAASGEQIEGMTS